MTNKKKNTKKLVARTDDDPSVEIENPESLGEPRHKFEPEVEVDAQTFDMYDLEQESKGRSRAELETALGDQAKLIEELNFEIEQLRSRRRGLEEELKAREEITENISCEVKDLRIHVARNFARRRRHLTRPTVRMIDSSTRRAG